MWLQRWRRGALVMEVRRERALRVHLLVEEWWWRREERIWSKEGAHARLLRVMLELLLLLRVLLVSRVHARCGVQPMHTEAGRGVAGRMGKCRHRVGEEPGRRG